MSILKANEKWTQMTDQHKNSIFDQMFTNPSFWYSVTTFIRVTLPNGHNIYVWSSFKSDYGAVIIE